MDPERKKKLEALREKKKKRDELIDNIVDNLAQQKGEETKEAEPEDQKPTQHEGQDQQQIQAQPKKVENLAIQQYVGEAFIESKVADKPIMYDQNIQVDLIEQSEQLLSPQKRRNTTTKKIIDDDDDDMVELPQKSSERRTNADIVHHKDSLHDISAEKTPNQADLSGEDIKNILKSKGFLKFFDKASKMIEKAIDSKTVDMIEPLLDEDNDYQEDFGKELIEGHTFFDQQKCSNRVVTSLDWSPHIPDLFLSSYSQSTESNPNDPQGVVLLWSQSLKNRPEFSLFCQSQVTAAKFNHFSNSTVVGGTYSGQIVIWDLRAKSSPVQRSGTASGGHAHPVYSLAIVGTQNSHNIVSVSNDGKMCVWNTSMLNTPQKTADLKYKPKQGEGRLVNTTCICFPDEEANNFYAGVEDGTLYSTQVHANQSNDNITGRFQGHQAPISSINVMPHFHDISSDVSNLVLTSSFDWSVKLWNPKLKNEPLCTFESAEDYVYDVCWNRANPCLFTSVDGEGYIDLWNLSQDLEMPIIHQKADNCAINKAAWNRDGSKLITGNSNGSVKLFGLNKNLMKASEEQLGRFEANIINMLK